MAQDLEQYYRVDKLPHIWCPGCGHGIVTGALVRAIDAAGIDPVKTVVVSGIGCSGRAPGYLKFDTLHTTHGRALAFAEGIKMANPELNVIVITGDGDGAAIGGNHLIHACRRNIDITTILFNNQIYGMTSGQYSPLTPPGALATTAPYGNIDPQFDISELAMGAGATYVARGTAYHTRELINLIKDGILHEGFSFIEAITQCPTYFGRRNKIKNAIAMLEIQKELFVPKKVWEQLPDKQKQQKKPRGLLKKVVAPEYTVEYQKVIEKAQRGGKNG